MPRALLLAVGSTLAGCACPIDASSDVSVTIHDGDWTDSKVLRDDGIATSPTRRALVSGPLVSPNYRRVGWVEDRGDHRMFDAIRVDSFTRDDSGVIHYEGAHGNVVYDVVDNVLGAKLATSVPVRVE